MKLNDLKIIDWNDDIFVGLGLIGNSYYTFVLRAKNFDTDEKIYFMIKVKDDNLIKHLLNLLEEKKLTKWDEINHLLNKIHEHQSGHLILSKKLQNNMTISKYLKYKEKVSFPLDIGSFYNKKDSEEILDLFNKFK